MQQQPHIGCKCPQASLHHGLKTVVPACARKSPQLISLFCPTSNKQAPSGLGTHALRLTTSHHTSEWRLVNGKHGIPTCKKPKPKESANRPPFASLLEPSLRQMKESWRPFMKEQSDLTWSTVPLPGPHQPRQTNLQALDRAQNHALRLITGATRTTPIKHMEKVTSIQDLQKVETPRSCSRQRSFDVKNNKSRRDGKRIATSKAVLSTSPISLVESTQATFQQRLHPCLYAFFNIWNIQGDPKPSICSTVPHVTPGDTHNKTDKCALTKALIEEKYLTEAWAQIYTDGSATRAAWRGGAGVFIRHLDGQSRWLSRQEHTAATTVQRCKHFR